MAVISISVSFQFHYCNEDRDVVRKRLQIVDLPSAALVDERVEMREKNTWDKSKSFTCKSTYTYVHTREKLHNDECTHT